MSMDLDLRKCSKRSYDVVRPMVLSAFFLLGTSVLVQGLGHYLYKDFWILSNRGLGKIIFTILAISCCAISLARALPKQKRYELWETCVGFLSSTRWVQPFLIAFITACCMHVMVLITLLYTGYATYQNLTPLLNSSTIAALLLGFIATFFLALTEECIFRGIIYTYCSTSMQPLYAACLTSLIFMFSHNITRPWHLVTNDIHLGIGLLLLGFLLNLLFILSRKLSIGMGVHAGLVFVKVFLRKAPCIKLLPLDQLPWWLHIDLRQAALVHGLLLIGIAGLLLCYAHQQTTLRK